MNFFPDVWACANPRPSRRTRISHAVSVLACSPEGITAFWELQRVCADRKISVSATIDTAIMEGPVDPGLPSVRTDRVPTRADIQVVRRDMSIALSEATHRRATAEVARQHFGRTDALLALLGRAIWLVEQRLI